MLVQSVPIELMTHDSMHINSNTSKHFTQEQTSLPTSGMQGDPMLSSVMISEWRCECLTFLLSDAILIVSAHQSAYKAEILTQSIKNSIRCQNYVNGKNQKAV
jgi:hypothetical protein